jgi:hypothetical protein
VGKSSIRHSVRKVSAQRPFSLVQGQVVLAGTSMLLLLKQGT